MITNLRIANYKAFNQPVELSLEADAHSKKFFTNYFSYQNYNILKCVGIYGKNNVGKSCLVSAAQTIKSVLLNEKVDIQTNLFIENKVASLGISFIENQKGYSFDFCYDTEKGKFVYEKYATFDFNKSSQLHTVILRDSKNKIYECVDDEFKRLLPNLSNDNIVLYTANTESFPFIEIIKNDFICFAKKIFILNMINIPLTQTLEIMKQGNDFAMEIAEFIKKADLEIDGFEYKNDLKIEFHSPEEKVLEKANVLDLLKLTSYHKNKPVPFMLFDSTGTKKVAALASYIIKNIREGGTVFVDELDSGLHFKLSRAIVAMYNNVANNQGQLIFTTHDINLMDCKKLFRKEQIWFADKDEKETYLYSLNDFKARDGVRADTTDIREIYKKGIVANLPEPDLISWLVKK